MHRARKEPREHWVDAVQSQGLLWHTVDGAPYWDETAYYCFTRSEVEQLEQATNELHRLCLEAVQHVIDHALYESLRIPRAAVPLIEWSWEHDEPSLYGRFDLAYDGVHPPKMLEYNADTPTSLVEAAVVQWFWLRDCFPEADQFNSIHERLIEKWRGLVPYLRSAPLVLANQDEPEDWMTCSYLAETAGQAGIGPIRQMKMGDIAWNERRGRFMDANDEPIGNLFKLYPWEWLVQEPFAVHLHRQREQMFWIEPAWKMILSNKGILPLLWRLSPGHPNLLEAHEDGWTPDHDRGWVRKPLLSREGNNVEMHGPTGTWSTGGTYGTGEYIVQELATIPSYGCRYPVLGSWVIDGAAAGIGIRESGTPITDDTSRFVPHLIQG